MPSPINAVRYRVATAPQGMAVVQVSTDGLGWTNITKPGWPNQMIEHAKALTEIAADLPHPGRVLWPAPEIKAAA